ncbi:MAG: YifB family Mg chelatase-like AAA ATPase [Planctomycetes bacterium]|nr:YifB family Mg chelatase-like AAA ATPase [Planctomycetota bacterium]
MAVRILGTVLDGLEAVEVTVEARYSEALRVSEVKVVGLPDAAVKEGMLRARSAAWPLCSGRVPPSGVLVNLAPADIRKTGRALDLALAMVYAGMLLGVEDPTASGLVFLGEVGLGGAVRPVRGVLAGVMEARGRGRDGVVLPRDNLVEARLVEGPALFPVDRVEDALAVLRGGVLADQGPRGPGACDGACGPDFADVRGQFEARHALEIAAAGRHNLLMEGPPGAGKTMLARRLPSILPQLTDDAALEVARIRSAVRTLDAGRIRQPPFRAPHHSATSAGLIGGGNPVRPGELSQAHHGVLFLDEIPEFDRRALEMLREPMEECVVHLTRVGGVRRFPADFIVLAAMNPCPCGWHGLGDGRCRCTPRQVQRYRGRLSGPLLDRFDMRIRLLPVPPTELLEDGSGESSDVVRGRVEEAREAQRRRWKGPSSNGRVSDVAVRRANGYDSPARSLLIRLVTTHRLSARATRRLERVARTVADLEGAGAVTESHLMLALRFRLGGEMEAQVEHGSAGS